MTIAHVVPLPLPAGGGEATGGSDARLLPEAFPELLVGALAVAGPGTSVPPGSGSATTRQVPAAASQVPGEEGGGATPPVPGNLQGAGDLGAGPPGALDGAAVVAAVPGYLVGPEWPGGGSCEGRSGDDPATQGSSPGTASERPPRWERSRSASCRHGAGSGRADLVRADVPGVVLPGAAAGGSAVLEVPVARAAAVGAVRAGIASAGAVSAEGSSVRAKHVEQVPGRPWTRVRVMPDGQGGSRATEVVHGTSRPGPVLGAGALPGDASPIDLQRPSVGGGGTVAIPAAAEGALPGDANDPRPGTALGAPGSPVPARETGVAASPGRGPMGVPIPRDGASGPGPGRAEAPEVPVPVRGVGPGRDARGGDACGVPGQAGVGMRGPAGPVGAREAPPVSDAARRILEVVERLQQVPPPRQVVVELPDLDGLRVLVEARGTSVHVVVLHGPTHGGQLDALARELAAGLSERGFDLAGFSRGREREREPEPRWRQVPVRSPDPQPRHDALWI